MKSTCPVSLTEFFIARAGLSFGPLFRKVIGSLFGCSQLSYSSARKLFLRMVKSIGLESSYGLHSLRAGGASQAAKVGIPDRHISSLGGWRSASSRNCYIQEAKASRLATSRLLGL